MYGEASIYDFRLLKKNDGTCKIFIVSISRKKLMKIIYINNLFIYLLLEDFSQSCW
jgi:hypothetical protein